MAEKRTKADKLHRQVEQSEKQEERRREDEQREKKVRDDLSRAA